MNSLSGLVVFVLTLVIGLGLGFPFLFGEREDYRTEITGEVQKVSVSYGTTQTVIFLDGRRISFDRLIEVPITGKTCTISYRHMYSYMGHGSEGGINYATAVKCGDGDSIALE